MLKYHVKGNKDGELLIFITGAGVGKWMWKAQVEAFNDYKCVFFDLPGHGENKHIDFTTFENIKKEITDIIHNESKDNRASLVGLSIGSQVIMHMLKDRGAPIDKCIMVSGLNQKMKYMPKWILNLFVLFTKPLARVKEFSKFQASHLEIPDHMFEEYYRDTRNLSFKTLRNIFYENMNFSFDTCERKNTPCLVLVGEKEGSMMLNSSKKTAGVIEDSHMRVIGEAGHSIPYSKPEEFNSIVRKFLEEKL